MENHRRKQLLQANPRRSATTCADSGPEATQELPPRAEETMIRLWWSSRRLLVFSAPNLPWILRMLSHPQC